MVEEGMWLRAERQTMGRGRQGRAWDTPGGNLAASTAVRLRAGDPPASTLGFVAAVALEQVVFDLLPDAALSLKWPNDLLIDGAKLSGILLERADDVIVIGVGVNLARAPEIADRRTTSLAEHGAKPDSSTFAHRLAEAFAGWLALWRSEGFSPVRQRWTERAHPVDTPLRAALPDGTVVEGAFEMLDAAGALILRCPSTPGGALADETRRTIHAGDVFLV